MTFKIGDEVRIKEGSEYYKESLAQPHDNNPIDCSGKVIRIAEKSSHPIHVEWSNEEVNYYRSTDLELTNPEPEYKPFGELSDEEKAKLFLAWFNGETIEVRDRVGHPVDWHVIYDPTWVKSAHYRVQPKPLTKPSINWDHVHPDYNWLAVDLDGLAAVFEKEPKTDCKCWVEGGNWVDAKVFISFKPGTCNWKDSLVKRPK